MEENIGFIEAACQFYEVLMGDKQALRGGRTHEAELRGMSSLRLDLKKG